MGEKQRDTLTSDHPGADGCAGNIGKGTAPSRISGLSSLPHSTPSPRLLASLTSVAVWRVGAMQHLSDTFPQTFTFPTVRVLSETVNVRPGRIDAVLLSLGAGYIVSPLLP
jgi:hypothetical protein